MNKILRTPSDVASFYAPSPTDSLVGMQSTR